MRARASAVASRARGDKTALWKLLVRFPKRIRFQAFSGFQMKISGWNLPVSSVLLKHSVKIAHQLGRRETIAWGQRELEPGIHEPKY
jgi:hypothetical protein